MTNAHPLSSPMDDLATPRLDHVLLVVERPQPTLAFFTEVVGLRIGARPAFRFTGWWLYAGERAVVHMAQRGSGSALDEQVGTRDPQGRGGVVDHIAFRIADMAAVRQRLAAGGWLFHEAVVPETGERQFFIAVPDGPVVELVGAAR